ncbi:MAG: dienelactone hydrolase family protein [Candidatus Hydrogenedentes bacterium]|nr:dienelactone hydrolase family protein [Candidatus Hydrogenedentota bacterium]
MTDLTKLKGLGDWPKVRAKIEANVLAVIGNPSKQSVDLQLKITDETDFPGYVRRKINYFVDDWTRVSAWYFIPEGPDPKPAVLCLHSEVPQGKDEPAGIDGEPRLAYAKHFAEMGYVTLAPDSITVGERVSAGLEPFDSKRFYKDYPKASLIGKMLSDHMKCVELLTEASCVDPARIGVIGHGLGACSALFLAAFDDRVRSCVASCGVTPIADQEHPGRWPGESQLLLMPKLEKQRKKSGSAFEWDQIIAMIAPNPTLLVTALNDEVLPNTKACKTLVERAKKVYTLLGEGAAMEIRTHKGGHCVTAESLDASVEWFERWL